MKRNNLYSLLTAALVAVSLSAQADVLNPTIGNLLYEENFNSLDSLYGTPSTAMAVK